MHFTNSFLIKRQTFLRRRRNQPSQPYSLYYIGGVLTHAPALMALTNPTTDSYRRLMPGFNAPIGVFYSTSQDAAAVLIPSYAMRREDARFEFRPPDGTCNPYLAMAAMLMAGIARIQNRIDPCSTSFGPIEENILSCEQEHKIEVKRLPISLKEVLNALADDH